MKSFFISFLILLFCFGNWGRAEEFPINIFTAEYYYSFFTENLKYKLEKFHEQFPNRKLTTYWQYAINEKCDTLYSHAIIPQILNTTDRLTILMNITECGTPMKWFRFEYFLNQNKISPNEKQQIQANLVKFQLPPMDWTKYKAVQITTEDNSFYWTENTLFVQSISEYNTYEVKLTHSHFLLNNIRQNYFKLDYSRIKNDHQVNSKTLAISYQPANEEHFPQITYFNENGSKISAKSFLSDYRYYFSSTLNDLILDLTDITPKTFGILNIIN